MTSIRDTYIAERMNEWLDRFTPPRGIINNLDAQQRDADAMIASVLRFAPREVYGEWLSAMLIRLEDGMTTRSWPAPGELAKACRSNAQAPGHGGNTDQIESHAIQRMADWFVKFRGQMPGHGKDSRTAELIRRGTLSDEREARFFGFDLSSDMTRRALEQRMGQHEWRHHINITAKLRGIHDSDAEAQIGAEAKLGPANRDLSFTPKRIPEIETF